MENTEQISAWKQFMNLQLNYPKKERFNCIKYFPQNQKNFYRKMETMGIY
jgi:hypothetical protein